MTWVVAHASPAAVAVIGDVRVTLQGSSSSHELAEIGVKKVHHILPNIVVGFAGSIPVGFRMVDELRHFYSWRSTFASALSLTEEWCDYMRERFWQAVPPHLRRQPTHLIVAGFHPSPTEGSGSPPIPIGTGTVLECPLVEGEPIRIVRQFGAFDRAVSIGSGTGIDKYRRLLDEFDWLGAAQAQDSHVLLGALVQWTIDRRPSTGVSRDVIGHVLVGTREGFFVETVALGDLAQERERVAIGPDELRVLLHRVTGSASLTHIAGQLT